MAGGVMCGENKSHFIRVFMAAGVLVLFTVIAAVSIVTWVPMVPEVIAVNIVPDETGSLAEYVALHESWHYMADLSHCVK